MVSLIEVIGRKLKKINSNDYIHGADLESKFVPTNFVVSDFIHFDKPYSFNIAISEDFGQCKGKNWFDQNKEILSSKLLMSNVLEVMTLFQNVVASYKDKNKVLFDSAGNPIKDNVLTDLYKFMTLNYNGGSWFNLNALFENKKDIWIMKEAVNYDQVKDELIFKETEISVPITENCYADFNDLTKEGFPKTKHLNQNYAQGENIKFLKMFWGGVAWFGSAGGNAYISCSGLPSISNSALGVRVVYKDLFAGRRV